MKWLITTAIIAILGGCATQHEIVEKTSLSMTLMNQGHPFVSQNLAKRIGLLIIEDRYPSNVFLASESVTVLDGGSEWRVTFTNALVVPIDKNAIPMIDGAIVPRVLTITIRKKNGEILNIS